MTQVNTAHEISATKASTAGKLLRATFWSSVSSFANLLTQVVRAKVAAICLGPMGVAVITQLNSFLVFGQIIGGFGHASGVVRETSQSHAAADKDSLRAIHQTFLFALTCTSTIAMVASLFFAGEISSFLFASVDYADHVRLTSLAIPFAIAARFFQSIIKGFRNVRRLAMVNAISNTLSVICFMLLVVHLSLWGAVVAIVVTQFTLAVVSYWCLLRDGTELSWRRPRSFHILRRNVGISSAGLTVGVLGGLAGMYFVRSVIAAYGEQQGGIYSATWRLSSVYLGVIFATTTSYYYPTIARLETDEEIGKEISNTLRLFQVALTPLIIVLIIFHEPIVRILLSEQFKESGVLLAYQLPGDLFRMAFDILALALLARGRVKQFVCCYVVWFVVYVAAITVTIELSQWLPSCCIAHSLTYTAFGLLGYLFLPSLTGWRLEARAYLTLALSAIHLSAAATVSLSCPNLLVAYSLGIVLSASWILIHAHDPAAKRLFERLSRKLRVT